jgi:hypothetical protein
VPFGKQQLSPLRLLLRRLLFARPIVPLAVFKHC